MTPVPSASRTRNFYPRSPCGERRVEHAAVQEFLRISIHALLAESDRKRLSDCRSALISIHALLAESDEQSADIRAGKFGFLSTLSLRRATGEGPLRLRPGVISIHALLAESDGSGCRHRQRREYFYPRSPCGERPRSRRRLHRSDRISIHALLAESDVVTLVSFITPL